MVQRCKPDLTGTEIGMSVFGGSLFVLTVVDMENWFCQTHPGRDQDLL